MCKFQHKYKAPSEQIGRNCDIEKYLRLLTADIDDLLPHDEENFCLFHSENYEWKSQFNVNDNLIKVIKFIDGLNVNLNSDDLNLLPIKRLPFSECVFKSKIRLESFTIKTELDISNSVFFEDTILEDMTFLSGIRCRKSEFEKLCTIGKCNINSTSFQGSKFDSLLVKSSTFFKSAIFTDCEISREFRIAKTQFKSSTYFDEMKITSKTPYYIKFEEVRFEAYLNFENTSFNSQLVFRDCYFKFVDFINVTFCKTAFDSTVLESVNFITLEVLEDGVIQFKGTTEKKLFEQGVMFSNMTLNGTIAFEYVNFLKILSSSRKELESLSKQNKVFIGEGCKKYYCQTEIFTINAKNVAQNLILDITQVFCKYFELQESANLGVEIIERTPTTIKYFYFTDERITTDEFLQKLNRTENNLWETLGNLSKYSMNTIKDVEKKNLLTDIMTTFIKLDNYTQNEIASDEELLKICDSISVSSTYHIDSINGLLTKIVQGKSKIDYKQLSKDVRNSSNILFNTTKQISIMNVTQNFFGDIEKVINADNFYEGNQTITTEQKNLIIEDAKQIKDEKSVEKKEMMWQELIKTWAGTISEVAIPILKELIMPK